MIDLHVQSSLGNGDKSVFKILEEIDNSDISYFSIVDLNHAFAYNIIERDKYPNLITATRIECIFNNRPIELLGYDIDTDIINDYYNKNYTIENIEKMEKYLANKLFEVLETNGYPLDNFEMRYDKNNGVIKEIYKKLIEKYPDFVYNNVRDFRIYGVKNPHSKFFVDQSNYLISVDKAISLIKEANGKVFLAHPFEYRFDISSLLEMVIEKNIDGVEVFHASCSHLNSLKLINFCESANKLASVGSGFLSDDEHIPIGVYIDETLYEKDCFNWIFNR